MVFTHFWTAPAVYMTDWRRKFQWRVGARAQIARFASKGKRKVTAVVARLREHGVLRCPEGSRRYSAELQKRCAK